MTTTRDEAPDVGPRVPTLALYEDEAGGLHLHRPLYHRNMFRLPEMLWSGVDETRDRGFKRHADAALYEYDPELPLPSVDPARRGKAWTLIASCVGGFVHMHEPDHWLARSPYLQAEPGELEVRMEPGGWRFYLDGHAVHAGDVLELRVYTEPFEGQGEEKWIRGRYEWSYAEGQQPTFHVHQGWASRVSRRDHEEEGREPANYQARMGIPPFARLRWPPQRTRGRW